MKLNLALATGTYAFTGLGMDHVLINGSPHHQSLILMPDRLVEPWALAFADLDPSHFATIAALGPEIVLFGSGTTFRFPPQRLIRPLVDAGIGMEVMDTAAACRTFSVLAGEGRRVAAAILLEPVPRTG